MFAISHVAANVDVLWQPVTFIIVALVLSDAAEHFELSRTRRQNWASSKTLPTATLLVREV